jgi:hypothetical protein
MFECNTCYFKCNKKYDWDRHIQTEKHKKAEIVEKNKGKIQCECGKYYSSKSGMWMHKKKCNVINNKVNEVENKITAAFCPFWLFIVLYCTNKKVTYLAQISSQFFVSISSLFILFFYNIISLHPYYLSLLQNNKTCPKLK